MDTTDDHICKVDLLRRVTLFKAALHHATPVFVGADLVTVRHARVEDELCKHRALL